MSDIAIECAGKWHGIFNSLGIEVGDGKHCGCPICGGVDRFRFDNKENKGTWFCNHCGAGDGFSMVQKVLNCDFAAAAKQIEPLIGRITTTSNEPQEPTITPEKLRAIYKSSKVATQSCQVGQYLHGRGLKIVPATLRYAPKCWNSELKKEIPAMLAVFTMPDGTAVTMHRTYLDGMGGKAKGVVSVKKALPSLKKMTGGAIRLWPVTDGIVGVAEGIETAIAAHELTGMAVWSVMSTTIMAGFIPPKGVTHLHIFADNDLNYAGQRAAYELANKISVTTDISVIVHMPEMPGTDWLDEHNKMNGLRVGLPSPTPARIYQRVGEPGAFGAMPRAGDKNPCNPEQWPVIYPHD